MATTSPIAPTWRAGSGEHATAPHDITAEPPLDALPYLDHRSRARTVPIQLAAAGHYLAVTDGDEEVLLPIRERIMHIGRSITSDIRFDEPQVSRRHAIVVRYGHHVRMLDDRSSNGTFVNGCRVIATDLQEDDVVRLGRLALRYVRIR